jgi:hypothetical protein
MDMPLAKVVSFLRPRRRWAQFSLGILFIAVTLACVWLGVKTHLKRMEARRRLTIVFGSMEAATVVARPEKVTAYRVGTNPPWRSDTTPGIDDFPLTTGPVGVPAEFASNISAALVDPDSYGWNYAKPCIPQYGVRLVFDRGGDRVDVLLCFECDILAVAYNGTFTGGEDFDPVRPVFVRAVKAVFTNDRVIQGLVANR